MCNCRGNGVLGSKQIYVKRKYELKLFIEMSSNYHCSL